MSQQKSDHTRQLLEKYLESLPGPNKELTSEIVEQGMRAKDEILSLRSEAVPVVVDGLSNSSFIVKDACYDLLIQIGQDAIPPLNSLLSEAQPIVAIWIISVLHYLGDRSEVSRLFDLLKEQDDYVRNLAALAISFQGIAQDNDAEALLSVLIEALSSTDNIEGTSFSVADASLACLTILSGKSFLPPEQPIIFYNFQDYAFPPPVHPFPFTSNYLAGAPEGERNRIIERIESWWERKGKNIPIKRLDSFWQSGS